MIRDLEPLDKAETTNLRLVTPFVASDDTFDFFIFAEVISLPLPFVLPALEVYVELMALSI